MFSIKFMDHYLPISASMLLLLGICLSISEASTQCQHESCVRVGELMQEKGISDKLCSNLTQLSRETYDCKDACGNDAYIPGKSMSLQDALKEYYDEISVCRDDSCDRVGQLMRPRDADGELDMDDLCSNLNQIESKAAQCRAACGSLVIVPGIVMCLQEAMKEYCNMIGLYCDDHCQPEVSICRDDSCDMVGQLMRPRDSDGNIDNDALCSKAAQCEKACDSHAVVPGVARSLQEVSKKHCQPETSAITDYKDNCKSWKQEIEDTTPDDLCGYPEKKKYNYVWEAAECYTIASLYGNNRTRRSIEEFLEKESIVEQFTACPVDVRRSEDRNISGGSGSPMSDGLQETTAVTECSFPLSVTVAEGETYEFTCTKSPEEAIYCTVQRQPLSPNDTINIKSTLTKFYVRNNIGISHGIKSRKLECRSTGGGRPQGSRLYLGRRPLDVNNVSCMEDIWSSLKCEWTPSLSEQKNYVYQNTKVKVVYKLQWTKKDMVWGECPQLTQSSCTWESGFFVPGELISLRIWTESVFGDGAIFNSTFNTSDIVATPAALAISSCKEKCKSWKQEIEDTTPDDPKVCGYPEKDQYDIVGEAAACHTIASFYGNNRTRRSIEGMELSEIERIVKYFKKTFAACPVDASSEKPYLIAIICVIIIIIIMALVIIALCLELKKDKKSYTVTPESTIPLY